MTDFRISYLPQSTVLYLYSERDQLHTDPVYQRQSDIWSREKKQLLIDSILNGYDIPKLYFHELSLQRTAEKPFRYAIVDGKQRLSAIWDFIDNKFALSDDFEYLPDPSVKLGGLTYPELAAKHPRIKIKFDSTSLPIVAIQTDNVEFIEDLFSRLNEAVPLNAAEKRNAFGGPIPRYIRDLTNTDFFKVRIPFDNTRYRHFDLSVKFLYIEYIQRLGDTKKRVLDDFVKSFRKTPHTADDADELGRKAYTRLDAMSAVFVNRDELLQSLGTAVLYYNLFREGMEHGWVSRIKRSELVEFEALRRRNRRLAEEESSDTNLELIEYDRLSQSSNDEHALKSRYQILKKYLDLPNTQVSTPTSAS